MQNYFSKEGNVTGIAKDMIKVFPELGLSLEIAEECLEFICTHQEILGNEEIVGKKMAETEMNGKSIVIGNADMFIGIKAVTVLFVCFLLKYELQKDISFDGGVIGAIFNEIKDKNLSEAQDYILGRMGLKGEIFRVFDETNAEKCIILELKQRNGGNKKLLKRYKGECANNDFNCCFNHEGKCTCPETYIQEMLDYFEENKILRKKGMKYYIVF
ncbi:MAG: hypothetical protein HFH68_00710 [Lachnospiraceae bacterium]|nr:hypothetical protein [Lachnospiraceae bacterium]